MCPASSLCKSLSVYWIKVPESRMVVMVHRPNEPPNRTPSRTTERSRTVRTVRVCQWCLSTKAKVRAS